MIYGILAAAQEYSRFIAEQDALRKIMQSDLPEETKQAIMKARRKAIKRQTKHNRKLQIAREGRSLNFWGNP